MWRENNSNALPPRLFLLLLIIETWSRYSVAVDKSESRSPVMRILWSEMWKLHLPTHGFPYECVIHGQDVYLRQSWGHGCDVIKENSVYVCVCVCGKVEVSIQVALGRPLLSILLLRFWITNHLLFLLININIILYCTHCRLTLKQNKKSTKKPPNRSDKLQHHIISRIKPKGTAEVV